MLGVSGIMAILGGYGMISGVTNSILYLVFGRFGLLLTLRDFRFFKNFKESKQLWVSNHFGKMIGALIASITTFIVAGLGKGNLIAWIDPSIIGTIYIIYWKQKVKPKSVVKTN